MTGSGHQLSRARPPGLSSSGQVVRGFHKALISVAFLGRISWLALRTHRTPFKGLQSLRRLRARHSQHWTTPTRHTRWFTATRCVAVGGRYFFDAIVPGWPSRAFDRAVEAELTRESDADTSMPLHTAVIGMTTRCGMRCEHCFEWDALRPRESLTLGDLHRIVAELQRHGVAQLLLSGGEPLQRLDDLLSVVRAAASASDVWVLTSGAGLTRRNAERLRDAGLTGVAISLDHWDASAHDRFRGVPGSFAAVVRGAAHVRRAGLVLALSLCPTREFVTRDNLQRYARTARALGAHFIQMIEPKATGRYSDRDVAISPAQQRLLEQFAERLNADGSAGYPVVRYLDWSARKFGCGGGMRSLYVDTDGVGHACPFCRQSGVSLLGPDVTSAVRQLRARGCGGAS